MGECEMVGGKVAGMAVVIGARIASLAEAGQVLVSGSVRDLMTGSDRHFEGGDLRELKGVADQWRVYRLVPEPVDGNAVPARRMSMVPLYTRRQRRRLVVVIAAMTVVVLAVSAGYVLTRPEPTVTVGENAVGVIGPGDQPRVSATVGVGQRPSAVASGFGSVWVTNSTDDSVTRIDKATNNPVRINVESGASPSGIATGAGAVWVANTGNATVSKIDPVTSRVTTMPVRSGPTGIVVAFGSVWVANSSDAKVSEIDPDTDKVVKEIPVGAGPAGIAAGAGYLWVTNQADGTVTRFLPDADEADSPITVGNGPLGIAIGDDAAWVANNLDGSVSRIDLEDLSVTSRTLVKRGGAYGVAAHGRDVWVSNENASSLMRVTARTFQLGATVPLHGSPLGLAFVGDDLWFTSAAGGSLHRGGVLTMVAPGLVYGEDPPVLDPLTQGDAASWRLAAMTNDGLVGFRRAGGAQGAGILPDLATTLPEPTKDGLTYTFHLRKGVRYSTGAPVLAGDIRRGIERTVVHPDTAPSGYYASAIVGGKACEDAAQKAVDAGRQRPGCDLSKGITADDRTGTITFHLTKPTPEFLYQLALPNASAIPQDTPVDLQPGSFLPATGPYKVGSYSLGRGRLELVRNTQFHVWSPAAQPDGYPDRIVLKTGYSAKETVARVTDGRADIVWDGVDPYETDVEMLRTRYGSQLHTTAGTALHHLFLNATKPPFNKLDARRAVAYAIDRGKLTKPDTFLGTLTCQFVPPNFPAFKPYCPFTVGDDVNGKWAGPDLVAARESVRKSGTRGAKVVVTTFNESHHVVVVQRIVDTLNGLGYRASVNVVTDWPGDFNATVGLGWADDYPTPSSHVGGLGSCDPDLADLSYNVSHYCDPKIDKQIAAALAQEVTDPGKASDTWAAIDREMVDAAAIIPFQTDTHNDFVSRRVGNPLIHPITGPLIAQMWVK
jgi:peptide/nickel transport system substrate-binding protein